MKLLLDQNLSHRLIDLLDSLYPGTEHVSRIHLDRADDLRLWQHAKDSDFAIMSKDTDFLHLSVLHGHPPKVIYLEIGNGSTADISALILSSLEEITSFIEDSVESFLILKPA